jgi:hypothetical protein
MNSTTEESQNLFEGDWTWRRLGKIWKPVSEKIQPSSGCHGGIVEDLRGGHPGQVTKFQWQRKGEETRNNRQSSRLFDHIGTVSCDFRRNTVKTSGTVWAKRTQTELLGIADSVVGHE